MHVRHFYWVAALIHLSVGLDLTGLRLFELYFSLSQRRLDLRVCLLSLHVLWVLIVLPWRLLCFGMKIGGLRFSHQLFAVAVLLFQQQIRHFLKDYGIGHDHLFNVRRLGLRKELLGVIPTHRLQGVRNHSFFVKQFRRRRHDLHQARDFHHALRVARRVRVSLRRQFVILNGLQEGLFIPVMGGLFVALPKAAGIVFKRANQQPELLSLRGVKAFVDRVHNFGGLINHGQRCANRGVGTALADLLLAGPANSHAGLRHVVYKRHQCLRRRLVGQGHYGLIDWETASFNKCTSARRHTENICILTRTGISHEKTGEVGIHSCIK